MNYLNKVSFFAFFLLVYPLLYCPGFSKPPSSLQRNHRNPKVLILIIASDNFPGVDLVFPYPTLKKIWGSYMHTHPNIEAYFIQGDPNLSSPYEIQGDVIWSKTEENLRPGILNKTLLSIQCMLPRINEFDYVLRTNLSSFYVFPRLLHFLQTLPQNGCYSGFKMLCGEHKLFFGHGCGFIMSTDVATYLVNNQDDLKRQININSMNDDVVIGHFFEKSGIHLTQAPLTYLLSLKDWKHYQKHEASSDFHFRVKNKTHKLRATHDVSILKSLLKKFYGLSVPEDLSLDK